jgi:hypothetical protein
MARIKGYSTPSHIAVPWADRHSDALARVRKKLSHRAAIRHRKRKSARLSLLCPAPAASRKNHKCEDPRAARSGDSSTESVHVHLVSRAAFSARDDRDSRETAAPVPDVADGELGGPTSAAHYHGEADRLAAKKRCEDLDLGPVRRWKVMEVKGEGGAIQHESGRCPRASGKRVLQGDIARVQIERPADERLVQNTPRPAAAGIA